VVFLGDSITAWYAGSPSWAARIAPLGAIDLGIPGLTVHTVQEQVDAGALDGMSPRVIVLMIGTNDLTLGVTPKDTATGVAVLLSDLRARQPQAQVLLLGILPREPTPALPLRQTVIQTNALIAGLADGSTVHFLDIGPAFLQADGTISRAVMADFLYPTPLGYAIESNALVGPLVAMLSGTRSVNAALGPSGEVVEVVFSDGTLIQFDAAGAHTLGRDVRSASLAFSPSGEVLTVVLASGTMVQLDAAGPHVLGQGVRSASVSFGPFGELLDVLFADGNFLKFDAQGAHQPDTF
jgi:lysophospholipase L1-like esterase